MTPVVSFVGCSNSGKTTLLLKVVEELKRRGYRLAVIKHDSHGFDIDKPGKDSWRMTQAGSDVVVISSAEKMAVVKVHKEDMPLDQLVDMVGSWVDVVITEGYKGEDKPKIEVYRAGVSEKILCREKELLAMVTDKKTDMNIPQFAPDDENCASAVADIIVEKIINKPVEEDIRLTVDGKDINLKSFIKDAFIKTISGMVSTLHETENAKEIKINITIPR